MKRERINEVSKKDMKTKNFQKSKHSELNQCQCQTMIECN